MREYKSGVSALITVLLLLLLTVVSFYVLTDWFQDLNLYIESNYKYKIENNLGMTQILGIDGENLYFQNSLSQNLAIIEVKVDNINCNISSSLGLGFKKINLSSCYANISQGVHEFLLVTNSNVYSKRYYLNNYILGTSSEDYDYFIKFVNPTPATNLNSTNRDYLINVSVKLEDIENISFYWNEEKKDIGTQDLFFKIFNGSFDGESSTSIITTLDGGYAFIGNTYSYPSSSHQIVYLAKYDLDNNLKFYSYLDDGTYHLSGQELIELDDGSFVIVGIKVVSAGDYDTFLSKFDSDGNEIWTNYLGGSNYDRAYNVFEANDGGFIVTSQTTSYTKGSWDGSITKFDSDGSWVWSKRLGSTHEDTVSASIELSDGNILATGQSQNFGDGPEDTMLYKFDSSGNVIWAKYFADGSSHAGNGNDIINTSDNNYVIVARSDILGNGDYDWNVIKFNSSGNVIWTNIVELPGASDIPSQVIETSDGNYVVGGYTQTIGEGDKDMMLIKFNNTSGEILWTTLIGGSLEDNILDIVELTDGNLGIVGISAGFAGTNRDGFIIKTDKNGKLKNFANYSRPVLNATIISNDFMSTSVSTVSYTPLTSLQTKSSVNTLTLNLVSEVENKLELKGFYPNQYFEINKSNLEIDTNLYFAQVCNITNCFNTEIRNLTIK